jgi:hypothetical protein
MGGRLRQIILAIVTASLQLWYAWPALGVDSDAVRNHAEQSYNQLTQQNDHSERTPPTSGPALNGHTHASYSPNQYVIGVGQGDLTKGPIVCQRVSELSARTDLAKQIRILVKEHTVESIRERSGKEADQDIEVTREEIVQEYLQGVKIIDRQIDQEKNICTATAVMPKSALQVSTPSSGPPPLAPVSR